MLNLTFLLLPLFFPAQPTPALAPWTLHGPLQIAENGHYLQYEDGNPFLWMGDTGWGLSWQLAIQLPGAPQVAKILPNFLREHRWWQWQPRPDVLVDEDEKGEDRKVACQSAKDEYLVYFPQRDSGQINLDQMRLGKALVLTWFRPENGEQEPVKEYIIQENMLRCTPPKPWEDAILIIKPDS